MANEFDTIFETQKKTNEFDAIFGTQRKVNEFDAIFIAPEVVTTVLSEGFDPFSEPTVDLTEPIRQVVPEPTAGADPTSFPELREPGPPTISGREPGFLERLQLKLEDIGILTDPRTGFVDRFGRTAEAPPGASLTRIVAEGVSGLSLNSLDVISNAIDPDVKTFSGLLSKLQGLEKADFPQAVEQTADFVNFMGRMRTLGLIIPAAGPIAEETARFTGAELFKQVAQTITEDPKQSRGFFGETGGIAVIEQAVIGMLFGLAEKGIVALWNKLLPAEQSRALAELGLKKGATPQQIRKAAQQRVKQFNVDFDRLGKTPTQIKAVENKFKVVIKARDEALAEVVKAGKIRPNVIFRTVRRGRALPGEIAPTQPVTPPVVPPAVVPPQPAVEAPIVAEAVAGAVERPVEGKRILFHGGPVEKGQLPTVKKSDPTDIRGVFFTEDKETARFFGEREGREGVVREFEVDIKNPASGEIAEQTERNLREEGIKEPQLFQAVTDELLDQGFDAVIRESGAGDEIIVLKDEIITAVPNRLADLEKEVEGKRTLNVLKDEKAAILREPKAKRTSEQIERLGEIEKQVDEIKIIVPEQIQKGKAFKPVSKKGPGLTKAEQEVLTPEQQEEFRFKQTQGEKAGFKAGMQEVVAENRAKIKTFQLATKLSAANRTDALEVVKQFVPKEKQAIFTKRILEAKTPQRVDRITKAVELFIDKAEKRAAVRDFKALLNKTNKEFRRGEVQLGKLPTDIRERVIEFVDAFDPAKITEKKRKQLEKRDVFIKRVSGTVANAFESLEDVGVDILQIPNARISELQRLSKLSIGELSTEEVNYITASVDHLIQTARKRGESRQRARSEKIAKQVNKARQEVSLRAKEEGIIKQPVGVAALFRNVFVQGQSSIRTMVGRATVKDNKASMDLLVENIQSAKRAEHVIIKEFSEASEKVISTDLGFTEKDSAKFDKLVPVRLGGKTFKIDLDNLFSIYMHIRAEGNLRQLLNSEGLNITVVERNPKLLNTIKSKKQILTGRVQLAEVRKVVEIIEAIPKFRELAETTFKLNKDVVSPKVNETSIAFQNFEIARKDKYWPQPRSLIKNVEGKATDVSVAIEQQGMFLPKKGGSARLLIRPYRSQFVNILQTSAQFAASTLSMQDAKSLLGNKQWQDNMRKAGRGPELKGIITMFRRMQGLSTDKAFVDLAGAKLLNNFGKSVLSLRLSGYGVQVASIPAAHEFIAPKYFKTTDAIRKIARIPPKDIKEMEDLSPTLWVRWKAKQFNYVTGGVAAQHSFNNMILSKTPLLDKFLNQYTWGDQKAIKIIFDAAQNKVAAEQNLKKGTAANKKAAIKETERALETQPNWDIIYRSPLTSSPNVFLRGSLMFQSARNAQMNVLMRAIDDFNKGRTNATEAGKRMGGVLHANILVAVVKRLLKFGIKASIIGLVLIVRDEEEDAVGKISREGLEAVKRLPQDTVMNIIGLPAFGNIPATIARETIRSFQRPASTFRKLSDVRTGNFFADLTLDATSIGISTGSLVKHLLTQEEISRGPREGRPKWKDDAEAISIGLAELIAIRYGLPLSAPRQELFFQTKAALRAIERPSEKKPAGRRKRGRFTK